MTIGITVLLIIFVALLVGQFMFAIEADCPTLYLLFGAEIILFAIIMRSF